jgi:Uma2 family endonuclease
MTQSLTKANDPAQEWEEIAEPDISKIITEDDTPVDNLISEKQQRLLVNCLYSSFSQNSPFLATANVGLFYGASKPPLVPDVLLSLGVSVDQDWSQKKNRSYFTWNFGKPPEVAIEIVSNSVGNELGSKLIDYANAGVSYYVVFDPLGYLGGKPLLVYERKGTEYELREDCRLEKIGLGLRLWTGVFEGKEYTWIRWCDRQGNLLLQGNEQAEQEKQRAEQEKQRAEQEKQRAEQEKQRAEKLMAKLRELGVDADEI